MRQVAPAGEDPMERKTERIIVWLMWLPALVYILSLEIRHPTPNLIAGVGPLLLLFILILIGLYWPFARPPRLCPAWLALACRLVTFAVALYVGFVMWRHRHSYDLGLKPLLLILVIVTAVALFRPLRIEGHLRRLLRRRPPSLGR